MPWKKLSDEKKKFLKQFLPARGRGIRDRIRRRKDKKELFGDYTAFEEKKLLLDSALFEIQLAPDYPTLQEEFEEISTGTMAKGTFAQGLGELNTLLGKVRTARDAMRRAASDPENKLNPYQEALRVMAARAGDDELLVARLGARLSGGEDEGDKGPLEPGNLPQVIALTQVQREGRAQLTALYKGDLTGDAYQTALNDALNEIGTARDAARGDIERLMRSDEELGSAGEVLVSDRAYREELDECEALMQDLAFWGHPKAMRLEKDLTGVRKDTRETGAYDVGVSALTLWKRDADAEKDRYLAKFNTELETHKTELARIEAMVDGFGGATRPEQRAEYDDLIAIAKQTIDNAQDDSRGKNLSALQPLQGILVSASVLANELGLTDTLNRSIADLIKEIEPILGGVSSEGSPKGKTVLPNMYTSLRTKFTELNDDWVNMSPQDAHMAFVTLKSEATAFATKVDEMEAWRRGASRLADQAASRTKELGQLIYDFGKDEHGLLSTALNRVFKVTGVTYEGAAAKELAEIQRNILSEDPTTHSFTMTKLGALNTKLEGWLAAAQHARDATRSRPPTAVAPADLKLIAHVLDDQSKAVAEREAHEAAVADFVSKSEKVEEMIDRLASDATLSEETVQEYGDIKRLSEAAKTQAQNDLEAAEEMHSRVKFRMTKAMGAPPKAVDNFDWLQKMPAFWKHATGDMRDGIERLIDTVNREAVDEPDIDQEQLEDDLRMLTVVSGIFANDAFDAAAAVLGDRSTASDLNRRKKAREAALRQVRLYRGYLTSNMLMRHAIRNPFKVDGIGSTLALSLNKIELEVLRGI